MRSIISKIPMIIGMVLITGQYVKAQEYSYVNRDGESITKYRPNVENISGTRFLNDSWTMATLTNGKGTTFTNVMVKYDIYNDRLTYNTGGEEAKKFGENIKKFIVNEKTFINGFPSVDTLGNYTYYEVVADGNVKLLKHHVKRILESKGYGSSMVNYRFDDRAAFYIYKDVKMHKVTLDKKSILAVLNDKADQINTFIASKKLNFKKSEDLKSLFDYYNSLQ